MTKEKSPHYPLVTIIIPLYIVCDRFFRDLLKFNKLNYPHYEIIIVSDKQVELPHIKNTRLILTGLEKTGPAEKRDLALEFTKGEICAFIDDDAYPHPDWLKKATRHFSNKEIVAVGGPGVTPQEDGYWEHLSGLVYESFFCSGALQERFVPLPPRYVVEWPAYNLLVKTKVLKKVGGYGNTFYGAEDILLCSKLVTVGKIYYDPSIVVYHHRRKLFFGLLEQIANIGLHRGYFFKRYPETSRKWFFPIPSLLTISLIAFLVISLVKSSFFPIFLTSLLFFILLGASSTVKKTQWYNSIIVGIGIILVHISYGLYFIKGLLTKNLKR